MEMTAEDGTALAEMVEKYGMAKVLRALASEASSHADAHIGSEMVDEADALMDASTALDKVAHDLEVVGAG